MIGMAVRQEDVAYALDRRVLVGDEGRVAGEERIDQHGHAVEIKAESGMSEPGDLHGKCPRLEYAAQAAARPRIGKNAPRG